MAGPPRLTDPVPAPGGRATIIDVAAAAGVSRQTVTRAMNGMSGISAATKQRVLAAAERLDYRPSRFGRGLVTGGDHQLGLVVNDLRNPYTPQLASAVFRLAAEQGWNVMLADVDLASDADRMVQALGSQTDVVIGYLGSRRERWNDLLGTVPMVELDPSTDPPTAAVWIDPADAIEELADHLVATGVRHPVVLDNSSPEHTSVRGVLMVDALRRRGYLPELVHAPHGTAECGAEETTRILRHRRREDAVLAFNDVMALGVLQACRRGGVDVPGDIRVVGVDGLPLGGLVSPTLTTLAVDLDAVAREALGLALGMLAGELPRHGDAVQRTVRHRLLLRESA
ncbi:transcriptional regulator, LacI family [Curtobacterium sp. 314Chir4.1]|jgi:DNA-binding LacI/PurR family transcriptional regulator|uniref:LacI family DNA-binding transcriptional regulator n=1 Tax=Curtobacterium sp. 314Chir4.1 TaxID=1279028 RepID=UPI000BDB93DD|nr:LacI family DNA-binding transcriptional regulator [Curtobacterium sp. 314Chir4.1]SOC87619.1 transcriptional regulator, LacI family [Curtobacterium sp. 314Chir4.1]